MLSSCPRNTRSHTQNGNLVAIRRCSISSLLNNLVFEAFSFSRVEFSLGYKGMVWVFLSTETAHPSHLSCSGHQGSQSAQVVGGSGEGKQPPHLVDSSQLHFL